MIKMKVHELVATLQSYDPSAEIIATWEGITQPIDVYQAADGRVMIDADHSDYKLKWQETKCEVCGEAAVMFHGSKPVCYKHREIL